jgi:prepilin peptidase CpaA
MIMSELERQAVIRLLGDLLGSPRVIVLLALLALAAVIDLRTRRIPNRLVFVGLVAGFVLYTIWPPFHRNGTLWALLGTIAGGGLLVPLYGLRMLGAGDVKLMAMVGSLVGPTLVLSACFYTVVCGGVLAIVAVLWRRRVFRLLANLRLLVSGAVLHLFGGGSPALALPVAASAGRLPYAVAIATGTAAALMLDQLGLA